MSELLAQSGSGSGSGFPWQFVIKVLVVSVILGGGVLERVLRNARENAKKRQAADAQRKREEEMLRTGRTVTQAGMGPSGGDLVMGPAPTMTGPGPIVNTDDEAKRRLAEIARRRREQIEQMARQGSGAGTAGGGGGGGSGGAGGRTVTPSSTPRSAPAIPTAPARRGAPPVVAVPAPRQQLPKPGARKEAEKKRRGQEAGPRRPEPSPIGAGFSPPAPQSQLDVAREEMRQADLREGPRVSTTGARSDMLKSLKLGQGTSAEELRRSLILSEVLGRPMALREGEPDRSLV